MSFCNISNLHNHNEVIKNILKDSSIDSWLIGYPTFTLLDTNQFPADAQHVFYCSNCHYLPINAGVWCELPLYNNHFTLCHSCKTYTQRTNSIINDILATNLVNAHIQRLNVKCNLCQEQLIMGTDAQGLMDHIFKSGCPQLLLNCKCGSSVQFNQYKDHVSTCSLHRIVSCNNSCTHMSQPGNTIWCYWTGPQFQFESHSSVCSTLIQQIYHSNLSWKSTSMNNDDNDTIDDDDITSETTCTDDEEMNTNTAVTTVLSSDIAAAGVISRDPDVVERDFIPAVRKIHAPVAKPLNGSHVHIMLASGIAIRLKLMYGDQFQLYACLRDITFVAKAMGVSGFEMSTATNMAKKYPNEFEDVNLQVFFVKNINHSSLDNVQLVARNTLIYIISPRFISMMITKFRSVPYTKSESAKAYALWLEQELLPIMSSQSRFQQALHSKSLVLLIRRNFKVKSRGVCIKCNHNKRNAEFLLCDYPGCDAKIHLACIAPEILQQIDLNDSASKWYCSDCNSSI
jgi:hypothetical protein